MAQQRTPFDRIEGSLEYIGLLRETIETTKSEIQKEVVRAKSERAERRLQALHLVTYNLERLSRHIDSSHRLLTTCARSGGCYWVSDRAPGPERVRSLPYGLGGRFTAIGEPVPLSRTSWPAAWPARVQS